MTDPDQLAALAEILRLGSFEAAARSLHVTPSAVSQRLKALEERLGLVLVERGPPARATPAGARLARHHQALALLERDLGGDLAALGGRALAGPAPLVRIAVNADSLTTWFLPALDGLTGLRFDLLEDDQAHCAEWLRRGEVLAAVTDRARPVQGCDVRPLGQMVYRALVRADRHAQWFGAGISAESLKAAPALIFNTKDLLQDQWVAKALGQGTAKAAPPSPVLSGHYIPSAEGFRAAIRAGLGWGMLPEPMLRQAPLPQDDLVELIPGLRLGVPLYWQWMRIAAGTLAPLTAALRQGAARDLAPLPPP